MILCDICKGSGSIPSATPFGYPAGCTRCSGTGRLEFRDLRHGDHLCLLYKNPAAQLADAVDFLVDGYRRGERLFYGWSETRPDDIFQALRAKSVPVELLIERGALEVIPAADIYLKDGEFEAGRTIAFYQGYIDATRRAGFTGLRLTAETSWALTSPAWVEQLGEYEARIDDYFRTKPPVIVLCQYNRTAFRPEIAETVLETHGGAVLA